MGLRVWSGGEIFGKKIKTLWGGHNVPPLIITKVKLSAEQEYTKTMVPLSHVANRPRTDMKTFKTQPRLVPKMAFHFCLNI